MACNLCKLEPASIDHILCKYIPPTYTKPNLTRPLELRVEKPLGICLLLLMYNDISLNYQELNIK